MKNNKSILKMRKIVYFKCLFIIIMVFSQCKYFEKEGFGKQWKERPDVELIEGNIFYIRNNKDTNSEYLFDRLNLDPRAIAKMLVVPYAQKLEKIFREKKYEDFYYEISHTIREPLAVKLGIYKLEYEEDGDPSPVYMNDDHYAKVKTAFMDSFRKGEGYCSTSLFFIKPIKKIEIRAYQAFDPRRDPETKVPIDYHFTYRIDFIHNDDPKLETDSEDRGHAITINVDHDFNKPFTIYEITRIINHCPVPELQDPVEGE
ncbi:hypothetical protein [Leptospira paudalimensis]|uniref:Lipoprotein n=1 Tax=Leptospira paudalimensis TaxID=2950024 RepID=A0ABT3M4D3_9LEPT|nr:hypothetical protein [Leptospira paudalimensis]MCW7502892.1 hypothetical protein [Leptospira paudalimensis]